jgi:hypothetical protein
VAKYKHSLRRKSDTYSATITTATKIINKDKPKVRIKGKRNEELQLI